MQVQRGDVESHLQTAWRVHLDLACLKLTTLESKHHEVYTWKITGFSELFNKAQMGEQFFIESFPFTLGGDYGCRLKLYLYPNGFKSGKNTHLSLYFGVLKGEYDAVLPWPLQKNFTFTLIDQEEGINMVKEARETVRRPVTDEIKRAGFDKYISHNDLMNGRYILDDTLFIQIRMD